jgi:hypothetical protein
MSGISSDANEPTDTQEIKFNERDFIEHNDSQALLGDIYRELRLMNKYFKEIVGEDLRS